MQIFKVEGMTCAHCERAITGAVQAVDGAAQVQVDLAAGEVRVHTTHPVDQVLEAIINEGYKAEAVPAAKTSH
ncbi:MULTISPECIES: heavy-metal-associated domain-containing protein [Pseudomonadaceae]|uniref:Copper chaperone n=1 Tax=Pseudomonas straminea TaxID=47882 RepID=A0A1I1WNM0_PSEOC|nr:MULTISPECIES: cation transporter [Pseudomonas]MDD1509264.1 cation transporter [Pseudomonas sp. CNPSo 3701]TWE02793.1 copper chaperone [Pseudomonas sp. AG1028]GLX15124.1 copper chaperone CopZ [Pseudomonas straminea]SFD95978.1 copper chaperone [Pseudomonas straminea]